MRFSQLESNIRTKTMSPCWGNYGVKKKNPNTKKICGKLSPVLKDILSTFK
jgi:hypothetical protein